MKNYTNELGHMTSMNAMPIYDKNIKKPSIQNQFTDDLKTWCVALSMRVLPRLFKLGSWIDLDLFYAKVKFGQNQNQLTDDLETWYVALSMRVLPRLFKL